MTDTPTPPMTPEQRAELVKSTKVKAAMINLGEAIQWGSETILMEQCADQLEADGVTIATITADRDGLIALAEDLSGGLFDANKERDAAQAEIARLTADLATARGDGMREAAKLLILTGPADYDDYDLAGRQSKGFDMGIDWSRETILSAITKGAAI